MASHLSIVLWEHNERGLWITLHMDLICTAVLTFLALIIFGIVFYQIKQKKTTAWRTTTLPRRKRIESSWNGNPSGNGSVNNYQK